MKRLASAGRRRLAAPSNRSGRSKPLRKRGDSERGDPIALLAQHFEPESVETESLARLRNRARLVDHKASHGRCFIVRQIPAHRAIELPDRGRAIDDDRPIALLAHAHHRDVVLVANIANDLLDNVFKCNQPLHDAVFVDDERGMGFSAQELLELVAQRGRLGNEPRLQSEISQVEFTGASASRDIRPEQVLGV